MPVEIKELVIRAVVKENKDEKKNNNALPEAEESIPSEKIIQKCVQEVLKILERKRAR